MVFPHNFEEKIDFAPLRERLKQLCVSEMGRDRVSRLRFLSDRGAIVMLLQQTDEMLRILNANMAPPLQGMHDCTRILHELKAEGSYCSARQLYQIAATLRTATGIRRFFDTEAVQSGKISLPSLRTLVQEFGDFRPVIATIERVTDDVGEVRDNASEELRRIRREIASVQQSMSGAMRRATESAVAQGAIDSDTRPVIRDGRLLLPLPAAARRSVPGIVYDRSATGKTIFVQPAEIIEAENRMRSLEAEENKEIIRILTEVADELRPDIPDLLECWRLLGIVDFIHAKALLARDLDAQLPHIDDDPQGGMELYNAVHPGLLWSMRSHGREAVPLNLHLDEKRRILLISGPNAGGKSVALKTVAVVQYMAQCGLLPTVRSHSHLRVFKDIFVDMGDEQSIQNELSTYSSHLANMKYMLRHSSPSGLILIDEIGSGTEPVIGAALARSILLEFARSGAFGIITTHYDSLKRFATKTEGIENGAMQYDTEQMTPLYRLEQGMAGSSFALEIARKSGLPERVIARAAKDVGREYTDSERYMQQIALDRKEVHTKRLEIERLERELVAQQKRVETYLQELRDKRQEMIGEARREANELLRGTNAVIERTIREIRENQADKEKTREVRRQLEEYTRQVKNATAQETAAAEKSKNKTKKKTPREPVAKTPAKPVAPLAPGSYVKTDTTSQTGQIISVQGDTAEVAFGLMRMKVKLNSLKPANKPRTNNTEARFAALGKRSNPESASRERQLQFQGNLDVRGMSVDEAVQAVTYFIDDAAQFDVSPVRILHGTGTGALRSALRQYLMTMPTVQSARDEDVRLGGAGITVVTLKD